MSEPMQIPLFDPDIDDNEIQAVTDVLKSKWLTMGERTTNFESEFAEFISCPHAIAVNNCTSALHLALLATGVGPGDEVICPSLTFVATSNAIRYCGATPIFADVESVDDWNISGRTIEPLISKSTKAILVVHYAGYVCDMVPIMALARTHGISVIEDAAHAPGAMRDGASAGTIGDAGCFSFFSNKNMTTGEGGMVTTHRQDIADQVRLLRSHAMTSPTLDRHRGHAFAYDVTSLGFNYRMSEINAALGSQQLNRLRSGNEKRRSIVSQYHDQLGDLSELHVPFANHDGIPAFHIMPVLLQDGLDRESVMRKMRAAGVQTSIHYRPINTLTAYACMDDASPSKTPLSYQIGQRTITLPLFPSMTRDMLDKVVASLRQAVTV